jgi:hypothetical protein
MTRGAAVVAVVVSLAAGYFFARWRRSEGSLNSAKALAEGARKAAGQARLAIVLTGLVVLVVIDLWFRGKGR